jgi:hypothetical protein
MILEEKTVRDLQFLDDNDRVNTMISQTEFTLKEMTLSAHLMKR